MPYQSIDQLQQVLAQTVFAHTQDKKKAAGRALGTLVELITFYMMRSWGVRDGVAIERPLPEYGNPSITHNVEFSIHPLLSRRELEFSVQRLPITAAKIRKALWPTAMERSGDDKNRVLLTSDGILTNCCTFNESVVGPYIAHLEKFERSSAFISVSQLHRHPYTIFECKRVGIEEGMKKGPQTIEKAKQGAYVARTVSSLQKVRLSDGRLGGLILKADGSIEVDLYTDMLRKAVDSNDPEILRGLILTVGVVSNHGNWFTSADHNKELKVLAQSYDWLLFLTDQGLADFIQELLLEPDELLVEARAAFLASYNAEKTKSTRNRFTKVSIAATADLVLQKYFEDHKERIESWFNVITPTGHSLKLLRDEISTLEHKDWRSIYNL